MLPLSLFDRAHAGDTRAREEIFSANVGLIWKFAQRYSGLVEREELFQLGALGLIKAIDRFDPEAGVAFSTFAVPHILGEIRRHLRDNALIKVDRRLRQVAYLANRFRREAAAREGREPPVSEVAERLGVPIDLLCQALESASSVVSLDQAPGLVTRSEEGETTGTEALDLRHAVGCLPKDERTVIQGRFFLGKTQSEIAEELGISQAQVSRLEKRALQSLRRNLSQESPGFGSGAPGDTSSRPNL